MTCEGVVYYDDDDGRTAATTENTVKALITLSITFWEFIRSVDETGDVCFSYRMATCLNFSAAMCAPKQKVEFTWVRIAMCPTRPYFSCYRCGVNWIPLGNSHSIFKGQSLRNLKFMKLVVDEQQYISTKAISVKLQVPPIDLLFLAPPTQYLGRLHVCLVISKSFRLWPLRFPVFHVCHSFLMIQ